MKLSSQSAREYLQDDFSIKPLPGESILAKTGRDLSYLSYHQKLNPIYGFENEINRAIEILMRSRKPNPIILGEAGVGKTAMVEKLAQTIVEQRHQLHYRVGCIKIIEMSYVALSAAPSSSWQEYVQNIKKAFDEASTNPIVLFIDEIHQLWAFPITMTLVKPMIERGDVRIIGATTLTEYHRFLETERALSRRFDPIYLQEPDKKRVVQILKHVAPVYEKDYEIKCPNTLFKKIYDLSDIYLPNTSQPAISLDILESAMIRQCVKKMKKHAKKPVKMKNSICW